MAATVSVEQVKAGLAQLHTRRAALRLPDRAADKPPAAYVDALAELQAFVDGDPTFSRLAALLERHRRVRAKAVRAAQAAERRAQAAQADAVAAAYLDAVEAAKGAAGLLSQPTVTTWTVLDKPFLIWQLVDPAGIFGDSTYAENNSSVKVSLDTSYEASAGDCVFYFLWENPSDSDAVVSATSELGLNGSAQAYGSSGVFAGNWAELKLQTELAAVRWTGWGNDPQTGKPLQGSQYPVMHGTWLKVIIDWQAYGGDTLSNDSPQSRTFDLYHPYFLNADWIVVPGRAVIFFEVSFYAWWNFRSDDGETQETHDDDGVVLEFATGDHRIACPGVTLEIWTPAG